MSLAAISPGALAQAIDLDDLGEQGFQMVPAAVADFSGSSISGAGDVNGDGLADIVIGAYFANPGGREQAGSAYVIFGKAGNELLDLANLEDAGFRIDGNEAFDFAGSNVSGAGDVNGDGLADVLIGATGVDVAGNRYAGASYVVFGKADSDSVQLADLGSGGFRIDGVTKFGTFIWNPISVSGAGDVNGDGLADVIIGVPGDGRPSTAGVSYVVFGKADSGVLNLPGLGSRGFAIEGVDFRDYSGSVVSGAGDVNGDGLADVVIGTAARDGFGRPRIGPAYVVFGKVDPSPVQLAVLDEQGFRIDGGARLASVSAAGDVNGDGLADLVFGSGRAEPEGRIAAGSAYVLFGRDNNDAVNLEQLESAGFRIDGPARDSFAGQSVAGASDVNGDGYADIVIGASGAGLEGRSDAGSSYVVFGAAAPDDLNLAEISGEGFRVIGKATQRRLGRRVAGAGDVNGDGLADILASAVEGSDSTTGPTYVVFSPASPISSATYQGYIRQGDAPVSAIGISGDGSAASHPSARAWIDFDDGNEGSGEASLVAVTLTRGVTPFADAAAAVSWEVGTDRVGWSTAAVQFRYLDQELLPGVDELGLQLVRSEDGNAPFTPLTSSVVNADRNTVSARIGDAGIFYLREVERPLFRDGFEAVSQ